MRKFEVGQRVTFKGSVGGYESDKAPEKIEGKVTSVSKSYIRIKILNDECFGKDIGYVFFESEFDTIVIKKPFWSFWR